MSIQHIIVSVKKIKRLELEAFKPCCNKDPLVEPKILWLSANLGKETSFQKQQIGEMHHNTQPCDLRIEQPNKVFLIGASGKQSPLPTPSKSIGEGYQSKFRATKVGSSKWCVLYLLVLLLSGPPTISFRNSTDTQSDSASDSEGWRTWIVSPTLLNSSLQFLWRKKSSSHREKNC